MNLQQRKQEITDKYNKETNKINQRVRWQLEKNKKRDQGLQLMFDWEKWLSNYEDSILRNIRVVLSKQVSWKKIR